MLPNTHQSVRAELAAIEPIARAEARRWIRDPADVDDVIQETLVRAWRSRAQRRGGDVRPWARQIARREAWRHLQRQRAAASLDDVPEPPVADHAASVALRIDVGRALADLEERDRAVVVGRYGLDLTQGAIADALHVPEGTVKVRLHRARKRLAITL